MAEPEYVKSTKDTTGTVSKTYKAKPQDSTESKIGQLEVKMTSLSDKLDSSLELKKWFTVASISFLGIIIGVFSLITITITNSLNHYDELQDRYYKLLIENKDLVNKTILNFEIKSSCAKNDSYWGFKNCLNSLPN